MRRQLIRMPGRNLKANNHFTITGGFGRPSTEYTAMSWIITHTGRRFDILDPKPDMIDIRDIAHSLSLLCRFNGHTHVFYSVAQHSCSVAFNVPKEIKLEALLHDAAEAYIGDIASPIKWVIPQIKEVEDRIEEAIIERFNLKLGNEGLIKAADLRALATEKRDLIIDHPEPWSILEDVEPFQERTRPWSAKGSYEQFLEYFYDYRDGILT